MFRIARLIYLVVAVVFLLGMGAAFVWGPGARRLPQRGEEQVMQAMSVAAFLLLVALLTCGIKLKSCRLSLVVTLTVLWLGIYTWLYWFSYSAPVRMTELFLDADKMHAESVRHFTLVTGMYLLVVGVFTLLPVLKFLQVRRKPSSQAAV